MLEKFRDMHVYPQNLHDLHNCLHTSVEQMSFREKLRRWLMVTVQHHIHTGMKRPLVTTVRHLNTCRAKNTRKKKKVQHRSVAITKHLRHQSCGITILIPFPLKISYTTSKRQLCLPGTVGVTDSQKPLNSWNCSQCPQKKADSKCKNTMLAKHTFH